MSRPVFKSHHAASAALADRPLPPPISEKARRPSPYSSRRRKRRQPPALHAGGTNRNRDRYDCATQDGTTISPQSEVSRFSPSCSMYISRSLYISSSCSGMNSSIVIIPLATISKYAI